MTENEATSRTSLTAGDPAPPPSATLEDLLDARHSCRAFSRGPIDQHVLERILRMAQRTASWCNAQPWTSYVMSGRFLDRTRDALAHHVSEGAEKEPDLLDPVGYTGKRLARRRQAGFALYGALGIERDDHEARRRQHKRNFQFFGAPHVVVVTVASELREYGLVDVGGYIATMLLAAQSLGVASCPQAAPALYAPVLRKALTLPDDERIAATVALGNEATGAASNGFRVPREPFADSSTFIN